MTQVGGGARHVAIHQACGVTRERTEAGLRLSSSRA